MKLKLFYLFLLGALFLSCEDFEEEIDPTIPNSETQTFGIRHDKQLRDYEVIATNAAPYNSAEYPDFSSVIKFCYSLDGSNNDEFVATGTLISPQWVLTAGHNFFVADEQRSPAAVGGIKVLIGNNPNNPSQSIEVQQLVFHPTWVVQNDGFFMANDLCLVKLKTPITNIKPAEVNFSIDGEPLNAVTWFAGYGDYSQRAGQNADLFSPKHATQNVLDRRVNNIQSEVSGKRYNGGLLAYDFDAPNGLINALGDALISEDEKRLGNGSSDAKPLDFEGTTVEGDSGGPIFVKIGITWKVAGVLSGGADEPIKGHVDSSYGDISIFIRTASHADWIKSVTGL